MHSSIHSLAHRAPPATRTRVRWQPYASIPSSASTPRSPPSTPPTSPPTSDLDLPRHPITTNLKTKYALGLVDQAVKALCDIWRPQDIPQVYITSRAISNSDLTVLVMHPTLSIPITSTTISKRNTRQLPSPVTPTYETSDEYPSSQSDGPNKTLIPLKGFVHEVLRRSKTSGSVLQTALCYLAAIRPNVLELVQLEKAGQGPRGEPELADRITPATQAELELELSLSLDTLVDPGSDVMDTIKMSMEGTDKMSTDTPPTYNDGHKTVLLPAPPMPSPLLCPRRAFLASLILASKFMQDKCYSNRAWAKLSGLQPREISRCERALGDALGWRLWVGKTPVVEPTPATRPVVRCRSESNLLLSLPPPFLSDQTLTPTAKQRGLKRCSTLPADASGARTLEHQIHLLDSSHASSSYDIQVDVSIPVHSLTSQSLTGPYKNMASNYTSPPTPGLTYSPSSSSSTSSGDRTIQMSTFLDDNMSGSFHDLTCSVESWDKALGCDHESAPFIDLYSTKLGDPGPIYPWNSSTCGPRGVTESTTATSGKMGRIDYFNCGISGSGWTPPYMSIDQVAPFIMDLPEAIKKPDSPFKSCEQFLPIFEKCAQTFGVPSILIASFALQESTCNPSTTGGAGEVGLMQLTPDKCNDAPNGNCYDPDYNILTGCKYFSKQLAANNGDFLLTCGNYNGWYKGMTYADATAAADGPCCRCQNNLDYLHQLLNGFLQNVNAYDPNHRLGKYFNLDKCHW
ncbi:hypothetical protein DFS33DRAFT_1377320 [Desarmillaria ectypa]|nr:hypothetical protein DFS33DRAFT_1377320 [Desarmillaria ectypa]